MTIRRIEKIINNQDHVSSKVSSVRVMSSPYSIVGMNNSKDHGSVSTIGNKRMKANIQKDMSPYLSRDKVQLLSQVTEKRFMQKRGVNVVSSFPLAINIYKASSDEFKALKKVNNKKARKSVLTLPNNPAPLPKDCTVSDMTESEYFNQDDDRKPKAKRPIQNKKKSNQKSKDFGLYERDSRYCSQMNFDLYCSSTDVLKDFSEINMKPTTNTYSNTKITNNSMNDVWSVLRSINKFQFRPSPVISEDDSVVTRKNKSNKWRNNQKDSRVIKSCRTEEYAYISTYDIDNKTLSISQSSSNDKVTVINETDEFETLCHKVERRLRNEIKNNDFKLKTVANATKNKIDNIPKTITLKTISPNKNVRRSIFPKELKSRNNTKDTNKKAWNKVIECADNTTITLNNSLVFMTYDKGTENRKPTNDDKPKINIPTKASIQSFESEKRSDAISTGTSNGTILNIQPSIDEKNHVFHSDEFRLKRSTGKGCNKDNIKAGQKRVSPVESETKSNSIIKVVFNNGQGVKNPQLNQPSYNEKQPHVTTPIPPKLTQTEIKRRFARLRFPLVVLSRDQLSSTFEVLDYEPLHFKSLEKHIWPFMTEWPEYAEISKTINKNYDVQVTKSKRILTSADTNSFDVDKIKDAAELHKNVPPGVNTRGFRRPLNKTKAEKKRPLRFNDFGNDQLQQEKKQIISFKNKMLKLLYRKITHDLNPEKQPPKRISSSKTDFLGSKLKPKITNHADISTETSKRFKVVYNNIKTEDADMTKNRKQSGHQPTWAKAKWASDFIENVIRKVRNGVYYNQNIQFAQRDCKEVSIQTTLTVKPNAIFEEDKNEENTVALLPQLSFDEHNDPFKTIKGFDNVCSDLKIETLNKNGISIKHCITNIVVHFDVTILSDSGTMPLHKQSSAAYIPVNPTKSEAKAFKCKTMVYNEILPAELCSLIPKMMRNILQHNNVMASVQQVGKRLSHLSMISEKPSCEISILHRFSLSPQNRISSKFRNIIQGCFKNTSFCKKRERPRQAINNLFCNENISELLPTPTKEIVWFINKIIDPKNNIMSRFSVCDCKSTDTKLNNYNHTYYTKLPHCTDLQLYTGNTPQLISTYNNYNIKTIMSEMFSYINNEMLNLPVSICVAQFGGPLSISNVIQERRDVKKVILINFDNVNKFRNVKTERNSNISYDLKQTCISITNNTDKLKCIEYIPTNTSKQIVRREHASQVSLNNNKLRKRSFLRLYKKCKSTTNISSEKSSTPLNKIGNMDDFFQVIGSGKTLSSIFDVATGNKILKCLVEMKSWITDISPRQALLVLLLMNKKETSNLARFRSIILQAIAVNRITRSSELDNEIEVIEREQISIPSQYEGISYLAASSENHDNLLEELQWIAKTTASDYQKPFDETSEKLLKSLLEKRKKLNPSYLRVMARYVGLGLLKTPAKN